jgi:FKBP-type peptidyl-prolyl cis-trans isomerase
VLLSEVATVSKIAISPTSSALGQGFNASVRVETTAGAVVNRGTVEILDNGVVVASASLSHTRGQISGKIGSVANGTGGDAFFTGTNVFQALYLGEKNYFAQGHSKTTTETIAAPAYHGRAGTLRVATEVAGSGAGAKSGQTVDVSYTGYLANGEIFDSSAIEAPSSSDGYGDLSFALGSGQTVVGFNNGIVGMQVGETRVIDIPSALGYGSTAQPAGAAGVAIPANSELIFVVTLDSIT